MTQKQLDEVEDMRVKLDSLIKSEFEQNNLSSAWYQMIEAKDYLGMAILSAKKVDKSLA